MRSTGERRGTRWSGCVGGGAGISTGRLKLNSDVAKLFLFLPTIPTKSFPKPSALLREEIIDFFLSTPFLFLKKKTPERGRSHISQLHFNKRGKALNALLSRQARRVDTISAERGPLEEEEEEDEDGACVL